MFDPGIAATIQKIVTLVPGFLLAVTVHEYTHGYVALRFGDPTAKAAGRLTFNPISHLDPIGTLALVLTQMIGWAKPVPVDPRYFRNPRSDLMWVSLGGPAANMVTAVLLSLLFHAILFAFDGVARGFLADYFLVPAVTILYSAVVINIVLAIFNLIPVPPLDGFKILVAFLPRDLANQLEQYEPYGFILLLLLLISGVIGYIILPPIRLIAGFLLGGFH